MRIDESFSQLKERIEQKYPCLPEGRFESEILRIQYIATSTHELIGKRVLDVGCGSKKSADRRPSPLLRRWLQREDPAENARFQPWFARILHEVGADVTGVDIGSNKSEEFKSYAMDLINPNALDQFQDESFDIANNYIFTVPRESITAKAGTSPALYNRLAWNHWYEDVHDCKAKNLPASTWEMECMKRNWERVWSLNDQIFRQIERVLKEEGVYTLAEFVYRKKDGVLKKEGRMAGLG